jgi:alkyl hydroperoxide reductase subunit AhpC
MSVWQKIVDQQFTILSDPHARVIRSYGLLNSNAGIDGGDIALDTTLLVDTDGRERWRHVSETLTDHPGAADIVARIRKILPQPASRK